MSLPPALLQRLAQRGLVNKQNVVSQLNGTDSATTAQVHSAPVENEEIIAEDYDEIEQENDQQQAELHQSEEYQCPSQYDLEDESEGVSSRKRTGDNYWLTQMKVRMAEAGSTSGFKGCPNKYNIWHKCTVYCVNRWGEGIIKPSEEYMKRYKRLIKKYPLPNGWMELYDPGCGCYYFACEADNVVSWLPPTHPDSVVTKCAAAIRRQMEESATREDNVMIDNNDENDGVGSDLDEEQTDTGNIDDIRESAKARHHREVEEIINASIRKAKSSVTTTRNNNNNSNKNSNADNLVNIQQFPSLEESAYCSTVSLPRKQKSRDLDRALSKQNKRIERHKDERDRNERNHYTTQDESEHLDPMDPSSYSHIPRGTWSDGLQVVTHDDDNNHIQKKQPEETKQMDKDDNNSDYQSD